MPKAWLEEARVISVWVSAYRAFLIPRDDLASQPPIEIDLGDARAVLLWGTLRYIHPPKARLQALPGIAGEPLIKAEMNVQQVQSPEGPHLILLLPYGRPDTPGDEPLTRDRVATLLGLLVAQFGPNIAFDHLYDQALDLASGQGSTFGVPWQHPGSFPPPDLSMGRRDVVVNAYEALRARSEPEARQINLSLRWFQAALSKPTSDANLGVDVYLSCWIAIETLVLRSTTNIGPIKDAFAAAYRCAKTLVDERYRVGKLYGLRNKIAHGGAIIPVPSFLLDYIAAVYVDLLFYVLTQSAERRAEEVLSEQGAEISELFRLHL